jgi:Ser/Thr protein kinase RdoA (MazF antagonist)
LKPFANLTRRGKARRLRLAALRALQRYPFEVAGLSLVGLFTNALFRVRARGGPSYLLRLCAPGWRTDEDLRSEVAWLQFFAADPEIGAPIAIPARNGEYIVSVEVEGISAAQRCMLMSWIPGTLLAKHLSEENLVKMGALFARLHRRSQGFTPPEGFTRRKMDSVYARGEAEVLFDDACRDAFTPTTRDTYERTRREVAAAFESLYANPRGLRVIHNDLHHENIMLYRGRLHPLDFEDTIWGYPVQDIAMALQDLMGDVAPDEYDPLLAAFRRGYESLSAWPETGPSQIDTFRAGRMLWVANYVARYEREYLKGFIDRQAPLLERFLATGRLRKV